MTINLHVIYIILKSALEHDQISAKTDLRISKSKTKVMRVNTRNADKLELDGEATDERENFTYLGSNFSKDGGSDRIYKG